MLREKIVPLKGEQNLLLLLTFVPIPLLFAMKLPWKESFYVLYQPTSKGPPTLLYLEKVSRRGPTCLLSPIKVPTKSPPHLL